MSPCYEVAYDTERGSINDINTDLLLEVERLRRRNGHLEDMLTAAREEIEAGDAELQAANETLERRANAPQLEAEIKRLTAEVVRLHEWNAGLKQSLAKSGAMIDALNTYIDRLNGAVEMGDLLMVEVPAFLQPIFWLQ